MKKFRFSLQRLLELRQRDTLLARLVYREKLADVDRSTAKVVETEDAMRQLLADVCDRITRTPTTADVVAAAGVLRGMQELLDGHKIELEVARTHAVEAQRVVSERRRKARVVEILKERALSRYRLEGQRESEKLADDLMLTRASRQAQ
ncbi:MAG: flagellar export protein FliJ [bacterium]